MAWFSRWSGLLVIGLILALGIGCAPPGPQALLEGRRLLDQGRVSEAIPRLEKAAEVLSTNAIAWSSLGVAYHRANRLDDALKAYQNAARYDDRMAVLRFNLGCLQMDRGNLVAAVDDLRTYTLLQPGAVDGWIQLGTALYRSRKFDEAEKCFRSALDLQARHPAALNGQGLISVQRRRWTEAANSFNAALAADTNYTAALLNIAIVQHQYLGNRATALRQYRRYAELDPIGGGDVLPVIVQLERELNPLANPLTAARAGTNAAGPATTKTALAPTRTNPAGTNPNERVFVEVRARSVTTNPAPTITGTGVNQGPVTTRAGQHPPESNSPARTTLVARAEESVRSPESRPLDKPPAEMKTPEPRPATEVRAPAVNPPGVKAPEVVATKPVEPPPPPVETRSVPNEIVVRPPPDQGIAIPVNARSTNANGGATDAVRTAENTPPPVRRGLLSRLNPFSRGTRGSNDVETTGAGTANRTGSTGLVRPEGLPELAPLTVARYSYIAPTRPSDGNRGTAEQAFKQGLRLQKSGDRAKAAAQYQQAIRADPGYFDSYYNLGLVALDSGDARLSLWAYEYALAIQPDAADARFNLSLALKIGGYPLDAAEQLQIVLEANPADARAHLSLANLLAQPLKQPRRARDHYLRVLEINPRHPDAPAIRYWLAANP